MDQKKVRGYWVLKYWYRPLYFSGEVVGGCKKLMRILKISVNIFFFTGNEEEGDNCVDGPKQVPWTHWR